MKEMEAKLAESTASSQRSEREYITLKESIQGMGEQWTKELDALKTDFKAREDEWKKQVEDSGLKYRTLTKLVQATQYVYSLNLRDDANSGTELSAHVSKA
jgi:hypothetical protein